MKLSYNFHPYLWTQRTKTTPWPLQHIVRALMTNDPQDVLSDVPYLYAQVKEYNKKDFNRAFNRAKKQYGAVEQRIAKVCEELGYKPNAKYDSDDVVAFRDIVLSNPELKALTEEWVASVLVYTACCITKLNTGSEQVFSFALHRLYECFERYDIENYFYNQEIITSINFIQNGIK